MYIVTPPFTTISVTRPMASMTAVSSYTSVTTVTSTVTSVSDVVSIMLNPGKH